MLSCLVIINRSQNDNADEVALQSQATTAAVVKLQVCQQVSSSTSRRAESERLSPVAGNARTESTTLAGPRSTKARARRPRGREGHGGRFPRLPVSNRSSHRPHPGWDRLPPGGEYGWMHLQDLQYSFDLCSRYFLALLDFRSTATAHKNDAFVAKIANTRLTKVSWPFLPSPKGCQLLQPGIPQYLF